MIDFENAQMLTISKLKKFHINGSLKKINRVDQQGLWLLFFFSLTKGCTLKCSNSSELKTYCGNMQPPFEFELLISFLKCPLVDIKYGFKLLTDEVKYHLFRSNCFSRKTRSYFHHE